MILKRLLQVTLLKPSDDFVNNGKWEAYIRSKKTRKVTVEIFDAAMICTGHHAAKYTASFEGDET